MNRDTARPIDRADAAALRDKFRLEEDWVPIQRFRDPDEARRALWTDEANPGLVARIAGLQRLAVQLSVHTLSPRGVCRFRTIEEADAHRDRWVRARVESLKRSSAS